MANVLYLNPEPAAGLQLVAQLPALQQPLHRYEKGGHLLPLLLVGHVVDDGADLVGQVPAAGALHLPGHIPHVGEDVEEQGPAQTGVVAGHVQQLVVVVLRAQDDLLVEGGHGGLQAVQGRRFHTCPQQRFIIKIYSGKGLISELFILIHYSKKIEKKVTSNTEFVLKTKRIKENLIIYYTLYSKKII